MVPASAQSIELKERDAIVWLQSQRVSGVVMDTSVSSGILFVNAEGYDFEVAADTFGLDVTLGEGENVIVACSENASLCSDTLRWRLGYDLRPEAFAYVEVSGQAVTLQGRIIENPIGSTLGFLWEADSDNPASTVISSASDSIASVMLPASAPLGEYYFDLTVTDEDGNRGRARTFVTVDSTGLTPFDIDSDHARWIDEAVIFEITPYIFEEDGGLLNVLNRLGEIAAMGVSTIWLQPVFETHAGGQGYDIVNYFQVRSDYGSDYDLHAVVERAHGLGMKVLLDFVPNHTAALHPYAQDVAEYGTASHYYKYDLTEEDDAEYSMHYKSRPMGNVEFIRYFWENLLIIDHDDPEVQRWMIEAGRHWIEEFDIDGYRIDAVWGTNARTPEMMQRWRHALKRYKPEVLLLGEDKATEPHSFEKRFDVAYDWYPGQVWVSHWTWQTDFSESTSHTIFNDAAASQRAGLLREAMTNRGDGWHPDAKVLRFMENNDTFRFIEHHTVDQTKMAAALLFALPGIPLIYNGQEIGRGGHPYNSFQVYFMGRTIEEQSRFGLYPYYLRLIEIRKKLGALTSDNFDEIATNPSSVYSFRRWEGNENVFGVINPTENALSVDLALPVNLLDIDAATTYYLTDQVAGDVYEVEGSELASVSIDMPATSTRILVLDDEIVDVGTDKTPHEALPMQVRLDQNYPNPFNPSTVISFSLPQAGEAGLRVFDVLGREIMILVDQRLPAGRHDVPFDASGLASGIYIYRLEFGGRVVTKQMLFVG
jgi:glycosidase